MTGRLVRTLCAVIQIPVLSVFHAGQDFAQGRAIAFQLIRENLSQVFIGESFGV
jgi:hypothetical protein